MGRNVNRFNVPVLERYNDVIPTTCQQIFHFGKLYHIIDLVIFISKIQLQIIFISKFHFKNCSFSFEIMGWNSSDVCPGFKSQGGFSPLCVHQLHTMDSADSSTSTDFVMASMAAKLL